ncbi:MAG: DUF4012 domain-containing protein [Candidatus Microthrix sp.]|nr:DUF4012 domain-containing protein [Candidatus Microthrix sp.]MBK7324187.1 DUF4012 domain-containing protein [Candidatus Microthrix sp.]
MTSQSRNSSTSPETGRSTPDASAPDEHHPWIFAPIADGPEAEGDHLGDSRFRSAGQPAAAKVDQKRRVPRAARANRGPWAWGGVAAVALGGALWVALWESLLSPTGQPGVDAVWRALLVALGAVAGARARRWTLFAVAAAASVFAGGIGLIAGLVGLSAISVALAADRRNWVIGAVAGAGTTIALMSLRPVGPLGLTALFGTILYLVLVASAYGRLGNTARRWVGAAAGVTVLLAVVGVVTAGIVALSVRSEVERAVDSTRRGAAATREAETDNATELLGEASGSFAEVVDRLNSPLLVPARLVPGVAQNLNALRSGAQLGRDLNDSAAFAATSIDYQGLRQEGGGVDLASLSALEVPVAAVADSLDGAVAELEGISSPWVVAPLRDRLDEVALEVNDLADETSLAQLALREVPGVLGADGPRRYLVMVANPAEARDFGGFMGGWALISLDRGELTLEDSGTPLELYPSSPNRPRLDPANVIPVSFLDMEPSRYPQNWTSSIDLDLVSSAAVELMQANGRGTIDGVIYVDPAALGALVDLTGPIPVPGTVAEINATNTEAFFTRDQFNVMPQTPEGDEALAQLTGEIFQRLGSSDLPGPKTLADTFGSLVAEGHLAMATIEPSDQAILTRLGLSAPIPEPEVDLLAIIERNLGPNKLDVFLERQHDYSVDWDGATGNRRATLTSTYFNDVVPDGLPEVVVGNNTGDPPGTQVRNIAILTPSRRVTIEVDGTRRPVVTSVEGTMFRHSIGLEIPPGETTELRWTIDGALPAGEYTLDLVRPAYEGTSETSVVARDGDRTIIDEVVEPGRLVRLPDGAS